MDVEADAVAVASAVESNTELDVQEDTVARDTASDVQKDVIMPTISFLRRCGCFVTLIVVLGCVLFFALSSTRNICNEPPAESTTISLSDYQKCPFGDFLFMRHADAPGSGDPVGFDLSDCRTQRNLGEYGRAQADQIGNKLSNLELDKSIYSSQWCRCKDTASLIMDTFNEDSTEASSVVEEWGLNSFYQPERGGFTKAQCIKRLRESMNVIRDRSRSPTLMVTHKVTVFAVTDVQVNSGGIVAFDSQTNMSLTLQL